MAIADSTGQAARAVAERRDGFAPTPNLPPRGTELRLTSRPHLRGHTSAPGADVPVSPRHMASAQG
ncbi:hypothetical protein OIE71_30495 [Streptomyces sp. NBC_01725]|uniref:hypothetical protein n=1 Tax=Streptomyces sp. NBC_01725 TaxID=2975923 RepID=UPI002E2C0F40|nr:hypothetical protein [Streptomyces sp. NBC_01725]